MISKKFLLVLESLALGAAQALSALALWWLKQKIESMIGKTMEKIKMQNVPAMTKAYDIQNLIARAKSRGLDLTEEAAKMLLQETSGWLVESAALSENKVDDLVAIGIPQLEKVMMPLIDKIDGQVG